MKEKTKITAYQLCKLSNVNAGNFDAFFNKGDNNKLSLKKCREMMWVLKGYQEE